MHTDIKIAISDDFLRAFAGIPRDRQQAVIQFLSKFRHNPRSSGINYEKIRDATDDAMRSVRIDQNYRGIVLQPEQGNVYCLLWIDKHGDAGVMVDMLTSERCLLHVAATRAKYALVVSRLEG